MTEQELKAATEQAVAKLPNDIREVMEYMVQPKSSLFGAAIQLKLNKQVVFARYNKGLRLLRNTNSGDIR